MASVLGESPYVERRSGERRRIAFPPALRGGVEGLRVSWGGVWGGVLVSMGMLLLLGALGIAVGVSAIDPLEADPQAVMTAAGIWGGVALLASLFVGGLVATRIGMVFDRATALFQGMLVWVVALLFMAAFAGSGIGLAPELSFDLAGSSQAAWTGLGAMLLSLLAAISGAMAGRRGAAQRVGRE